MALEQSDEEVGCMTVAPGTHKLGMLSVQAADTSASFTDVETVMPADAVETPLCMAPGDVVFFHGKTVHGSYPNRSADRWRRSFICHYVGAHAEKFKAEPGTHVSHVDRE
jgi:ectoine hydroxylase-related dioxygenase (phytanoyl-CoA dioxygenase family)